MEFHKAIRALGYLSMSAMASLLMIAASASAQAQGRSIGQVKTVLGSVSVVRGGATAPIKAGDPLYQQDVIQTGANSSIGVTFTDNTVMSAGPNSEVSLDEYNFDSSNFKGAMVTNVHRGTLSMISGDIAKSTPGAMKVRTPEAMLGVRGTRFVVQVAGQQ